MEIYKYIEKVPFLFLMMIIFMLGQNLLLEKPILCLHGIFMSVGMMAYYG
jgi:hypothetical protein